jgi:hypothetical protein
MVKWSTFLTGAVVLSTSLAGCGGKSPSEPSTPDNTEAAAVAETVGGATMSAFFSGGLPAGMQAGINRVNRSGSLSPHAAAGNTFGSAACPTGGRVDIVYVRAYTPEGTSVDTSALKAVFAQCALATAGASVQVNGELAMSGMFHGASQPVTLRLSGRLTTSAGECDVDGGVELTGAFNGSACGIPAQTTPAARSPAALAAVGSYALSVLGGSSLPRVFVDRPCVGYMNSGGLILNADGTYEMSMFGSFVCLNGPGPSVSFVEPGTWALFGGNIVFSALNTTLYRASPASVSGGSISVDVDVPSAAPDIPPTRMSATFTR